jgi:hypothetical protein
MLETFYCYCSYSKTSCVLHLHLKLWLALVEQFITRATDLEFFHAAPFAAIESTSLQVTSHIAPAIATTNKESPSQPYHQHHN